MLYQRGTENQSWQLPVHVLFLIIVEVFMVCLWTSKDVACYNCRVGAAYILYLSWQTWRRLPPSDQVQEKMPTWKMGFFLQMINVKIIIYGLTMFSAYILPYETRVPMLFAFAVYLMILGALGNLIWAFAGNVLKRGYSSHYRLMNGVMALLLVWCSLRIVGVL